MAAGNGNALLDFLLRDRHSLLEFFLGAEVPSVVGRSRPLLVLGASSAGTQTSLLLFRRDRELLRKHSRGPERS